MCREGLGLGPGLLNGICAYIPLKHIRIKNNVFIFFIISLNETFRLKLLFILVILNVHHLVFAQKFIYIIFDIVNAHKIIINL